MCGCSPRFYHFQTLAQVTCTVINQCPPLPTNVVYTSSCTDGRNAGSVCHFQCPANQVMSGTSHSTCGTDGQWSPRIDTRCSVQCSPLQPQASCSEIPCERARCPAFPDAVCQNNYCGGCNFKFFVNGVEKTRYQCLPNDCPAPAPTPTDPYFEDICLDLCMVLCPNHRDALCRPCGCTRRMYDYTTLQLLNC
uniref:Sushi domain-containing protein n=1 Tax=Ciona savignyi TaxID=51511 RepID=H2Z2M9_CIOSA